MNDNTPTREDLIELGYLKPGDTLARAPKRERRISLNESDLEYANRHGLTRSEMRDFKMEMIIEEEILQDHYARKAADDAVNYSSPQANHFAW